MIEKRGHIKNVGSVASIQNKKVVTTVVESRKKSANPSNQINTTGRRYYHNTRPNSPLGR